jgi:hypothetical protein
METSRLVKEPQGAIRQRKLSRPVDIPEKADPDTQQGSGLVARQRRFQSRSADIPKKWF